MWRSRRTLVFILENTFEKLFVYIDGRINNASNRKNTERKPHDNLAQTKQYSKKIYGYLATIGSHTQIIYELCLLVILDKFVG